MSWDRWREEAEAEAGEAYEDLIEREAWEAELADVPDWPDEPNPDGANHDDCCPVTGEEHEYEEAFRQIDVDRDVPDGWRCTYCRARPPEVPWDGPYQDDF